MQDSSPFAVCWSTTDVRCCSVAEYGNLRLRPAYWSSTVSTPLYTFSWGIFAMIDRWISFLIPDSWHWPWKHAVYSAEDFSYFIIIWWARYIGSFKVHDMILAMSMIIESIYIFVSCVCLLFPRTDSSLLKWWSEKVLMPEHPPWCMTSLCPSRGFFTVLFYALLRTYLSDEGKKLQKRHIFWQNQYTNLQLTTDNID